MNYRNYEDIFPAGYPYLPDEMEVRRQCRSWLCQMFEVQHLWFLSEKMGAIVDPYVREYTVTAMRELIMKEAMDPDSELRMNALALEQVETDMRRIVRKARAEQVVEEMNMLEDNASAPSLPENTLPMQGSLEANMAYLNAEVARINERLDSLLQQATVNWPTYCKEATKEDQQTFEQHLRKLCTNRTKTQTADIRRYLRLKEEQHIIVRPAQLCDEYEQLRRFGYDRAKKTYYNS